MTKYIISGKPLYVETPLWDDTHPQEIKPIVDDAKIVDTGLINSLGYPLYRLQDRIGFHKPYRLRKGS